MIPEIGHFCLVIALMLSVVLAVVPLWGTVTHQYRLMAMSRSLAYGQCTFLLLSFFCLIYAFVQNDFTVSYVVAHSNSQLPVWYRVSAVWGGHEGSLLLWIVLLAGWTTAVARFSRALPVDAIARVLSVMAMISIGLLLFTILTSNPFNRTLPDFPLNGRDLNPLLQDIGLIVHPPMLYMGYVGFAVAFAFAIAGLLSGQLDSAWARWSRPWTVIAWAFLTVGIALGSWWAYYELGWGGWWFWDPVENASLLPWLAGTALIHSLAVTEKRAVFKAWTVLLAIIAFSLSLLGTFLVRSGVLTSVHSFASDPSRGMFILVLLFVVVGGSFLLFAVRATALKGEGRYELVSREVFLMINNLLLMLAMFIVLLGTLFPLVAEVLGLGKVSVGPPYFNLVFVPVALILMVFMGVGSLVRWKRHGVQALLKPMWKWMAIAIAFGVIAPLFLVGDYQVSVSIALVLVAWVVLNSLADMVKKMSSSRRGLWHGYQRLTRSYRGMVLAHIGMAVAVAGIAVTSLYSEERDVRLATDETVSVGGYEFKFKGITSVAGPNYQAQRGHFTISRDGAFVAELTPEKRAYHVQTSMMTEAAIDGGLFRDLYVALGESLGDGSWAIRIYVKPLMRWVWGGALLMALGGLLAISDRRYRLAK
ncbi:MAG: heme lyase CcmF/NrfE family subunit [Pseudomonadales bacterium]|nr:heme lyase CcmF/NrfE family subunit [Pseudomonadales bacterium]